MITQTASLNSAAALGASSPGSLHDEQPSDRLRQYLLASAASNGQLTSHAATGGAVANLVAKRQNAHSTILEFEVAGLDDMPPRVLVKTPSCASGSLPTAVREASGGQLRPRLFESQDGRLRAQLEYAALTRIYGHFAGIDDPRFGAIRPLGFGAEAGAILMEKIQARSLKELLGNTRRVTRSLSSSSLELPLRNAGTWLRMFHQSPLPAHAQPRHAEGDSLVPSLQRICQYLAAVTGNSRYFGQLARATTAAAKGAFSGALPLAIAHCDYAPRNILVGPAARISAVDTAAQWQTPIYMDIGYFLANLKATRAQIYSCGCAIPRRHLVTYEDAFLRGYFGDEPIPSRLLRVYELQAVLDRWGAMTERLTQAAGGRGTGRRAMACVQLRLTMRFFRRYVAELL